MDILGKKWIFTENHLLFSVIFREIGKKVDIFGKNGYFEKVDIFEKMNIEAKLPFNY